MNCSCVPPADDFSAQMLRAIVEVIIDRLGRSMLTIAQTPEATGLSSAFEFFNSEFLFFGPILHMGALMGTMHTANDGEALGKMRIPANAATDSDSKSAGNSSPLRQAQAAQTRPKRSVI